MKLISDDVLTCAFYLRGARQSFEQELMDARDLLTTEDLPEPHERFKPALAMVDALLSDLRLDGDIGLAIADVVEALEVLADELPND